MKKLLSTLLVVMLIFSAVPLGAFELNVSAATEYTSGYYTYTIENAKATITEVDTSIYGDITIPSNLRGYPVASIGSSAFSDCSNLASVNIPASVTSIGSSAFSGCSNLASVNIPASVTSISAYMFLNCSSLTSIVIPQGVTGIGGGSFKNCSNLTHIEIPNDITSIGSEAFYNTSYYNDSNNWIDDVLYIEDCLIQAKTTISGKYSIKNGTKVIAAMAFLSCTELTDITIPESVISIDYGVFNGCTSLTSVYLPNSITSIGRDAFKNCSGLTGIVFPENVISIGSGAFFKCSSLTSIIIPNSVISLEDSVFNDCANLKSVFIGNNVTNIAYNTFYNCTSLESVIIGENVTSIGNKAFYNCESLSDIVIPDNVISIYQGAFSKCNSLKSITLPFVGGNSSENQNFGYIFGATGYSNNNSYVPSSLKTVVISDKCESIAANAFSGCTGLENVIIGNGITIINEHTFNGCTGLKNVVIPDSVTRIWDYAFSGCNGLKSLTVPNAVIHDGALYGCNSLESITLPYISEVLGRIFGRDKSNSASSTKQDGYYYYIPASLRNVTITDSTQIPDDAFENCSNLTNITINDGITSIGENAFYNCSGLTNITIPDSVTNIGYQALYGCNNLESLTVPFVGSSREAYNTYDSVLGYFFGHEGTSYRNGTIKQEYAPGTYTSFYYYMPSSLKSLTITDATQIPYGAFYNCENLTSITINDDVTSIGDRAFYQCKGIKNIIIPNKVTSIGMATFSGCTSLESVAFSDRITSIGDSAFDYRCESLTDVWYSGTVGDRENISISSYDNVSLTDATWHYETCKGSSTHTYDNSCDVECNVCNHIRTQIVHAYDNDCDTTCNNCDYTRDITHAYGEWIVDQEPTCVNTGSKHKVCDVCGDTITESVDATGLHNYIGAVTKPTCTAQGYTTYTCDMCGDNYVDDYVDANNHIYDDDFDAFCNECDAERDAKKHGDASGDDIINGKDCALLMQYINGWAVDIDADAADVNADGKVNSKDYVLLMRYLNGWDVELQ